MRWISTAPAPAARCGRIEPIAAGASVARAATAALALGLCIGCATPRYSSPAAPESRVTLPSLSVQEILAPVYGAGETELRRLDRLPDAPSVRLRRSFVWISAGETDRAIQALNRMIFGEPRLTRAEEAYARYLRSLAFAKQDDTERAAFDRREAARLAQDTDLKKLIAGPAETSEPAVRHLPIVDARPLPRGSWRAEHAQPRRMVPMGRITKLTIHHSALLASDSSRGSAASTVRSIQKTHIHANGWGDIGYHFLIDRAGRVWTGRELQWQGAHAGDPIRNRGNIGICLLGNFVGTRSGQDPSAAQLSAMEQVVSRLCATYGIPPSHVLTHREIRVTECPGERLQVAVDRLRQSMAGAEIAATR